jgi:hypothetical protein
MSLSPSPMPKNVASAGAIPHIHATGALCPTCDQPIPHDLFDEITARIEVRQSAHTAEVTSRLQHQFARDKADALEEARLKAVAELTERVASAREEERRSVEVATNEKIAAVARTSQEAQASLTARIEQVEAAKKAAEESGNILKAQLDQTRRDNEAAVKKLKEEAEANAATIRENARKQAEAAVQEVIAGLERSHQQSEAALQARIAEVEDAKSSAVELTALLQAQLAQLRIDGDAAMEKARQDADARVNAARHEATTTAETALQEKIATAEQAKADAEAKALAAETLAHTLKEAHEVQLQERVNEVRMAMEAAQTQAVNTAKAEAYEEKLRLSERLEDVQRAFDKKTAEEQGEGAEVNLFEALKEMFDSDKIERVGKGNAGADIIHAVMHNGIECGKIIYDSKDHNQWRNDFVTKLASDKIAAEADHAILSIRKFPQGTRQLHVHDGVILANPARVVALVQVVREHVVKSCALRLSNEAKAQKSAELYAFITSAQFTDLLDRIDSQARELQELQDSERKAHEALWKKQSIRFRSIQKAGADLTNRIDIILGSAGSAEKLVNDQ